MLERQPILCAAFSALIKVLPKISTTGARKTYILKVPVEKEFATTKDSIKAPTGVENDTNAAWGFPIL